MFEVVVMSKAIAQFGPIVDVQYSIKEDQVPPTNQVNTLYSECQLQFPEELESNRSPNISIHDAAIMQGNIKEPHNIRGNDMETDDQIFAMLPLLGNRDTLHSHAEPFVQSRFETQSPTSKHKCQPTGYCSFPKYDTESVQDTIFEQHIVAEENPILDARCKSSIMICPDCQSQVDSVVKIPHDPFTWTIRIFLICSVVLIPFAFSPCLLEDFKEYQYRCVGCKKIIALYKGNKGNVCCV